MFLKLFNYFPDKEMKYKQLMELIDIHNEYSKKH